MIDSAQVRDWLKAQDLGYLLETLDTLALDPKLSDWEAVLLAEKLADILLELDYNKCSELWGDFEEAERARKSFAHDHSAQYEASL